MIEWDQVMLGAVIVLIVLVIGALFQSFLEPPAPTAKRSRR